MLDLDSKMNGNATNNGRLAYRCNKAGRFSNCLNAKKELWPKKTDGASVDIVDYSAMKAIAFAPNRNAPASVTTPHFKVRHQKRHSRKNAPERAAIEHVGSGCHQRRLDHHWGPNPGASL
jgi:hypothetical protein